MAFLSYGIRLVVEVRRKHDESVSNRGFSLQPFRPECTLLRPSLGFSGPPSADRQCPCANPFATRSSRLSG